MNFCRSHLEQEEEFFDLADITSDVLEVSNARQSVVLIRITFLFDLLQARQVIDSGEGTTTDAPLILLIKALQGPLSRIRGLL